MAATINDFISSNGSAQGAYNYLATNLDKRGTGEERKMARGGVDPSVWAWFDQQTAAKGGNVEQIIKQNDAQQQTQFASDIASGKLNANGLTPAEIAQTKTADAAYQQRLSAIPIAPPVAVSTAPVNPIVPVSATAKPVSSVSGITPPNTALQPGATGTEVKQLQDYLVSQGLMTQAQVNTGYGTYGPQTTAAVKALQERLGVNNSSGVGYFGPQTIAAVQNGTTQNNSNSAGNSFNGGTATPPISQASSPASSPAQDTAFSALLNNPNLTPDQKAMVQKAYDLISTNDTEQAAKLLANFKAATAYSSPYFKAQTLIATDALSRALGANEGDLSFQEKKLQNTLNDLLSNTNASKDQLSFQHQQELSKLADSYKTDLENTRTDLASVGKSASSVRSRAEDLLNKQNEGLVESSNRNFSYQTGNLDKNVSSAQRDTSQQLAYLQDKNTQARIDALRKTEQSVGSQALLDKGYNSSDLLGGVGGNIPRQAIQDALDFSKGAGFLFA